MWLFCKFHPIHKEAFRIVLSMTRSSSTPNNLWVFNRNKYPFRELTYPIKNHFWRWFSFSPRWDMLIPWRVTIKQMPFFHTLKDYKIGDLSSVHPINGWVHPGTASLRPGACSLTSEVVGSSDRDVFGRWKVGDFFLEMKICWFKKTSRFLYGK